MSCSENICNVSDVSCVKEKKIEAKRSKEIVFYELQKGSFLIVAGQIGPKQSRPQSNHCIIMFFLFNLIICIVNCVVYLISNQIIVLLCCLFNLIICP